MEILRQAKAEKTYRKIAKYCALDHIFDTELSKSSSINGKEDNYYAEYEVKAIISIKFAAPNLDLNNSIIYEYTRRAKSQLHYQVYQEAAIHVNRIKELMLRADREKALLALYDLESFMAGRDLY